MSHQVQESPDVAALRLFNKIKQGHGKDFLWMNACIILMCLQEIVDD